MLAADVMIGHTSKVLLVVGVVLCLTLYWTQSRLDASAVPGPKPEVQPQFLTLGLLGSYAGESSPAEVKAAGVMKGRASRADKAVRREVTPRPAEGKQAKLELTTEEEQALLEAVLDLEMLEEQPPPPPPQAEEQQQPAKPTSDEQAEAVSDRHRIAVQPLL